MSAFPIVEFDSVPEVTYPHSVPWSEDPCIMREDFARPEVKWWARRAIDLRWVAIAEPWRPEVTDATRIALCGSGHGGCFEVRCSYPEFMAMWIRAKGISA